MMLIAAEKERGKKWGSATVSFLSVAMPHGSGKGGRNKR